MDGCRLLLVMVPPGLGKSRMILAAVLMVDYKAFKIIYSHESLMDADSEVLSKLKTLIESSGKTLAWNVASDQASVECDPLTCIFVDESDDVIVDKQL